MAMRRNGGTEEPRPRVLTYDQAVAGGRRYFVRTGRLDMQELADELAVSRATLYRVVGNRDRLLGEVFWSMGEQALDIARTQTRSSGIDRIVETSDRFNQYIFGFEPFRRFLRAEPLTALRVLFTPAGGVHERTVQKWKDIFSEAEETGELELPMDPENLAYVIVRVGESILYSDLMGDRMRDNELALLTIRAILQMR